MTGRTSRRYPADPAVKWALGEALDGAPGEAARATVAAMTEALDTLAAIHKDPPAPFGARVSAAPAILDAGPELQETIDLAERVAALEQQLSKGAR